MPYLMIRQSGGTPKVHRLAGMLVYIGRDAGCHVVLPNTAVSRRHAKLTRKDGQWTVEDLETPNGTLINDAALKRADLQHGDVIRVGRYRLEFLLEERMDEAELRRVKQLQEHSRASVDQQDSTHVLSGAMRDKLLAAEKARDLLVLASVEPDGRHWRPEGRPLTIGPGGDVPAKQFLRTSPVAVLDWDGQRYTITRRGFWGRVELNGQRVTESPVKPGDRLRVGSDEFELREQAF